MDLIIRTRPDRVITTSSVTSVTAERIPDGHVAAWRVLEREGIAMLALRHTPRAGRSRVDRLARNAEHPAACDVRRSSTLAEVDPAQLLEDPPSNVTFADLNDYLRRAGRYPAIIGNIVVYRDAGHFTATFARTLAPMLRARILLPTPAPAGSSATGGLGP